MVRVNRGKNERIKPLAKIGTSIEARTTKQKRTNKLLLEHDILGILLANSPNFQQTKAGLQQKAEESTNEDKQHVNDIGQLGIIERTKGGNGIGYGG